MVVSNWGNGFYPWTVAATGPAGKKWQRRHTFSGSGDGSEKFGPRECRCADAEAS